MKVASPLPQNACKQESDSDSRFLVVDGIVVEALHNRGVRDSAFHSSVMVVVIACTLFTDYFLYGILFPLAAHSPAKLEGEEQLAWLYGVYALSVLLVTPLFGYLGHRIGGRATMLYGLALAACAALLFGVASNFSVLLAARLFQGAALWTSGLAFTATHYVQKREQILRYAFTGGTFGSVIGPISGGFLYHLGGYRLPFLITGMLIVIDAALIVFLLPAGSSGQAQSPGIRGLLLNKSVIVPALAVALAAFSVGIIEPLLPVRLARFGATSMTIGLIFTVSTLVYGLSAPVVGRISERLPIPRVIVIGTFAMAATLPLLAVFRGVVLVCIALCLVNISFAFMLNPASAELANAVDRAGESCYSAVYAVYNICYSIGMLGTAALASTAVHWLSFWGVLLSASAILLLSVPFPTKSAVPKSVMPAESRGRTARVICR